MEEVNGYDRTMIAMEGRKRDLAKQAGDARSIDAVVMLGLSKNICILNLSLATQRSRHQQAAMKAEKLAQSIQEREETFRAANHINFSDSNVSLTRRQTVV